MMPKNSRFIKEQIIMVNLSLNKLQSLNSNLKIYQNTM